MKVKVDKDLCISCGLCVNTTPEIFDWDADGKAEEKTDSVPANLEGSAHESVEGCPTNAIVQSD